MPLPPPPQRSYIVGHDDVSVTDGGTGASTDLGARHNLRSAPKLAKYLLTEPHPELPWAQIGTPGPGVTDHGLLTGLLDDDHPQYLNILGRSGGQVALGGIDAPDSLIIKPTAAASGTGAVIIQPNTGATGTFFRVSNAAGTVMTSVSTLGQWTFTPLTTAPAITITGSNSIQIGSTNSFSFLEIDPSSTEVSFILTKATGSPPTHAVARFFTQSGTTPVRMSLEGYLVVSRATGQGLTDPTIQARVQTSQTGKAIDVYSNAIGQELAGIDAGGDLYGQGLELWDGVNASRILTHRYATGGASYELNWPASAPGANDSIALFSTAGAISYSTTIPAAALDVDLQEIAAVANVRGDLLVTDAGPTWVRLAHPGDASRFLRANTDDPGWERIDLSNDSFAGQLPVTAGGTDKIQLTLGNLLVGNGISQMNEIAFGAAGGYVRSDGATWDRSGLLLNDGTDVLTASRGGTGQSSYTIGDLLYASGATALSKLADVATGNALISGGVGVAPSWGKIGLTTHVTGLLPFANLADGSALSVLGRSVNSSGVMASIAAGTDNQVLRRSGTTLAFGAVNLASSNAVTGDLPYANFVQSSAASRLVGRGSAAGAGDWQEITIGANLTMTGTELSATGGGGAPHAILDGSTHTDSVAQTVSIGSLIYGNATPNWDELNHPGVANRALRSTSTLPTWAQGDIDFGTFKAIKMACDNGATVPGSPTVGQWFLHTPTGRNVLLQYDGTTWQPIQSYGNFTVFVDKTDGNDAIDLGGAADAGAFKTIQFAIDQIPKNNNGSILVNLNNESYNEVVTIGGKGLTGANTFVVQGVMAVDDSGTSTGGNTRGNSGNQRATLNDTTKSWTVGAAVESGTSSTGGTLITQAGQNFLTTCKPGWPVKNTTANTWSVIDVVNSDTVMTLIDSIMTSGHAFEVYNPRNGQHTGKLLYITGGVGSTQSTENGRIIEYHTDKQLVLLGIWDTTPTTSTYEIRNWTGGTQVEGTSSGLVVSRGQIGLFIQDMAFVRPPTNGQPVNCDEGFRINMFRCLIDGGSVCANFSNGIHLNMRYSLIQRGGTVSGGGAGFQLFGMQNAQIIGCWFRDHQANADSRGALRVLQQSMCIVERQTMISDSKVGVDVRTSSLRLFPADIEALGNRTRFLRNTVRALSVVGIVESPSQAYMRGNNFDIFEINGLLRGQAVNVSITGTGSQTIVGTGTGGATILAERAFVGMTVRVFLKGIYSTDATPGTIQIDVLLGATQILTTHHSMLTGGTMPVLPTSLTNRAWELEAYMAFRSIGAGGSVIGGGVFRHSQTGATGSPVSGGGHGTMTDYNLLNPTVGSTVAVSTLVDLPIDVKINPSSAGNTITSHVGIVEIVI